ncbi:MAG: hypothetical protein HY690_21055 [Chloroflexi bacterium]|nr:hypothetical protein [Chloroflexota bacterium]
MLERILKALRRPTPEPEQRAFAAQVLAALETARRCDEEWSAQVELTSNYPSLANLAAVQRWKLTRLAYILAATAPPPRLQRQASQGAKVLLLTAEAFHRLTNGYRFTKFERVCEGQAQLEQARQLRLRLAADLARDWEVAVEG